MKILALAAVSLFALPALSAHAADAANGKGIYEKKCAMCHGKDLKGNPAMTKVLKVDGAKLNLTNPETLAKPEADLIAVTTLGKEKMPAQKGKMKDDEIADSIAYIRQAGGSSAEKAK